MVSIIVPVYKSEKTLRRCVESLCRQAYADIEILLIVDGPPDGSGILADQLAKEDARIRVINQPNRGVSRARNRGLTEAAGEYIRFVDSDDYVLYHGLDEMVRRIEQDESDLVIAGFDHLYFGQKIEKRPHTNACIELASSYEDLKQLYMGGFLNMPWNKLYKKELFEGVVFPTGNFVGEDYYIVTQLLGKSKKVAWIPNAYYHYIQSKNSMSRGGYTDNYLIAYKNYKNISQNLIKQFPAQKSYIENYCLTEYASFIVAMGKNNKYNHEMIQQIVSYARSHKKQYLHADYIDTKFKLSVKAICYNYRILIKGYQLIGRLKRK